MSSLKLSSVIGWNVRTGTVSPHEHIAYSILYTPSRELQWTDSLHAEQSEPLSTVHTTPPTHWKITPLSPAAAIFSVPPRSSGSPTANANRFSLFKPYDVLSGPSSFHTIHVTYVSAALWQFISRLCTAYFLIGNFDPLRISCKCKMAGIINRLSLAVQRFEQAIQTIFGRGFPPGK